MTFKQLKLAIYIEGRGNRDRGEKAYWAFLGDCTEADRVIRIECNGRMRGTGVIVLFPDLWHL